MLVYPNFEFQVSKLLEKMYPKIYNPINDTNNTSETKNLSMSEIKFSRKFAFYKLIGSGPLVKIMSNT